MTDRATDGGPVSDQLRPQYQLQVRGPWPNDDWHPAIVGPPSDPEPRNFGTQKAAEDAMQLAVSVDGPFRFRVVTLVHGLCKGGPATFTWGRDGQ